MTVTVTLTPDLEEFVNSQVRSGLYPSVDDVLREGLQLLRERDDFYQQEDLDELRKEIAIGLEAAERGEVAPFDPMETLARVRKRREEEAHRDAPGTEN
jgi:antitoxin ParD1/3/4